MNDPKSQPQGSYTAAPSQIHNSLLHLYDDSSAMWRHVDSQTTSYNQVNVAIVTALLASLQFVDSTDQYYKAMVYSLVTLLGVIGFISTIKYRERLYLSIHRLRLLRDRLDATAPGLSFAELIEKSRKENRKRFPLSSLSTRGFVWWGLNLGIVVVGALGLAHSAPGLVALVNQAIGGGQTP